MRRIAVAELATKPFQILDRDWALLVSGHDKPNPMTVSWGGFGTLWNLPIVTVYVRPTRYTYGLIESCGEFTLNFMPEDRKSVHDVCGSASGRTVDKWTAARLGKATSEHVKVPRVDGAVLAFECRVAGTADVKPEQIHDKSLLGLYHSGDYHRIYFGHVLGIFTSV
jgi:flavin reductase (DIM6/NTAB) family NADH-FMN oxidoreductase RutF